MIEQIKSLRPKTAETASEETRIVVREETEKDEWQQSLRPKALSDYIGQPDMRRNLSVYIQAALSRGEALDHVLLYGPPGLGKTTMANIIANELGVNFRITSGPAIERPADLAAILSNLEEHDVLFIDEIHRLNRSVEEILYPAMEDFRWISLWERGPVPDPTASICRLYADRGDNAGGGAGGAAARPVRHYFPYAVLWSGGTGADHHAGSPHTGDPCRCRRCFGNRPSCERTPRIANRLLKRVRDFAQVMGSGVITRDLAANALNALHVDSLGLDATDREVLRTIIDKFNGGPVGIDTIAAAVCEERTTIEDVCEPYLMQIGFLSRTPRGRVVTKAAYRHLGLKTEETGG